MCQALCWKIYLDVLSLSSVTLRTLLTANKKLRGCYSPFTPCAHCCRLCWIMSEWMIMTFSKSQELGCKTLHLWITYCVQVFVLSGYVMSNSVTPWTVAHQAPSSMGFPRQESWAVLPFHPPGDFSNPRIEPVIFCIGRWILYHTASWETGSLILWLLIKCL